MHCKHEKSISDCNSCLCKILSRLLKSGDCYANAFIILPNSSSTVVRTFTQEEITGQNQDECLTIPLTSSCSGSYFQLSSCKSPKDNWCKVIDQANNYITSLQVPKCCNGCYNFDLSASVALTSTFTLTVSVLGNPIGSLTYDVNLPIKASLKLSEQMSRDICVADEVSETPETCFTAVTFPIIDTPMASAALGHNFFPTVDELGSIFSGPADALITQNLLNQEPFFVNLSCSGAVCLKGCQRLVPTLTLSPFIDTSILNTVIQGIFSDVFIVDVTFLNTKLLLSDLSLKLVKIGDCTENCQCQQAKKS